MKTILISLFGLLAVTSAYGEIKAKETLQISITGVPVSEHARLNSVYPVSATGYIEMWKIGKVKASGLTEAQLAANIASKFRAANIYSDPVFQIMNTDAARAKQQEEAEAARAAARAEEVIKDTKKFTVGGSVTGSGQQQWTEGMTLYAAVQSARVTPFGAINRVKLHRNGTVYTYNLKKDAHKSVKIYPNDLVEVPAKNAWGR